MHLYKISQSVNNNYDTYDSAIVAAASEDDARSIHPDGDFHPQPTGVDVTEESDTYEWCIQKYVNVEYIGEARSNIERGVILSSFIAG